LSDRTTQLIRGAKPMIKNTEGLTAKRIAELELEHNVMPLIIRRPLPDGKFEIWFTKELKH
jgi:DNA-directed RNA polymerase subunit K/omega